MTTVTTITKGEALAKAKRFADMWVTTYYSPLYFVPLEIRLADSGGETHVSVVPLKPLDEKKKYGPKVYEEKLTEWYQRILSQG